MRILVVGAGATGGYFGGRLAAAGRDVTFLLRPTRAALLKADGLQIVSPHGDVTLHPNIVTAPEIDRPFDVILVTVKAFSLDAALTDLAPAVGPNTMILSTLNGMKHIDAMIARFGAKSLVGCVCKVAATIDTAGRIVQLATFQELAYGELDGQRSARTEDIDAVMKGAGFEARLTMTIKRELWEKWIFLAALGSITCLMRGNVGEINATSGGKDFALALLAECIAVAAAAGHPPSDGFVADTRKMLTTARSSLTSSMYRDLVAGKPVEADHIVGDLLARGQSLGVVTPLLDAAYTNLSIYQTRTIAA
jgi:2-dehydropantoate 2-reductase